MRKLLICARGRGRQPRARHRRARRRDEREGLAAAGQALRGRSTSTGPRTATGGAIAITQHDYFFSPTFVKVPAGRDERHGHGDEHGPGASTASRCRRRASPPTLNPGASMTFTVPVSGGGVVLLLPVPPPARDAGRLLHEEGRQVSASVGAGRAAGGPAPGPRRRAAPRAATATEPAGDPARQPVAEEPALRSGVRVVVVRDVAHVVVDVVLERRSASATTSARRVVHVRQRLGRRVGAVDPPDDHRDGADLALRDPAHVVLVEPLGDPRRLAEIAGRRPVAVMRRARRAATRRTRGPPPGRRRGAAG